MPAMDALHLKLLWSDDLRANRLLSDYTHSYVHSLRGEHGWPSESVRAQFEEDYGIPVPDAKVWASKMEPDDLRLKMSKWLDSSDTFYIDPRMHALVTAASESMPQETLLSRDLPADFGFMLIPGGLAVIDIRGQALKYNAVQWAAIGGKVHVSWLTDKYDMQDSTNIRSRDGMNDREWLQFPRLSWGGFSGMQFGEPLPLTAGPDFLIAPEQHLSVVKKDNEDGSYSMAWAFDRGFTAEELAEKTQIKVRTDPALRWLLAAWRLMQQTVASVTSEEAPRQLRKQLQRKNLDTKVTVIGLRHKAARGEGETDVEWSHRWLVKGHWRNQKVKEDGEWTTRLVWVHAHIKGPSDKPLIIRDHVYALVR